MLKKTITYTDFDGNSQTEDIYFNLSKGEIIKMELEENGEFSDRLKQIGESNDGAKIIQAFEDILRRSYGVRSPDGKRFVKSDELFAEFQQTEAYSELFTELATDPTSAAAFVNGLSSTIRETSETTNASQVARAQSQAALQDRRPKAEHEGNDIVDVPSVETVEESASRKPTLEEINRMDISETLKAQLRASI